MGSNQNKQVKNLNIMTAESMVAKLPDKEGKEFAVQNMVKNFKYAYSVKEHYKGTVILTALANDEQEAIDKMVDSDIMTKFILEDHMEHLKERLRFLDDQREFMKKYYARHPGEQNPTDEDESNVPIDQRLIADLLGSDILEELYQNVQHYLDRNIINEKDCESEDVKKLILTIVKGDEDIRRKVIMRMINDEENGFNITIKKVNNSTVIF